MPTVSEKQEKFMQAIAHNPSFAKKVGVPQSVGKEFTKKDFKDALNEIKEKLLELKPSPLLSIPAIAEKEDAKDPCWEGYHAVGMKEKDGKEVPNCVPEDATDDTEAWQKEEGKNPEGGLNAKGRASYNKEHGGHLKAPQPEGGKRKEAFCARMKGMKSKLTSEKTANDPDSRINKSLEKWKCDDNATPVGNEMPSELSMPVDKDAGAKGRASGILFLTDSREVLYIRRGDGGDYPRTWAVAGGHVNKGETLDECARRECFEETGIDYKGELTVLFDDGQFCTFLARIKDKLPVNLNYESTGYDWAKLNSPPFPLHPNQEIALKVASVETELDVARLIAQDVLPSPQTYMNMHLLDIRITGTGLAYRGSIQEHVWRDPSLYLNQEFLDRCNGLTVIRDHPKSSVLNTSEFKNRVIGSVLLPYIKGDEVWGIAKIYDNDVMQEILEGDVSTSPSVAFDRNSDNVTLTTETGEPLLIEGKPFLLDHIAIVTKERGSKGVWDKGGEAQGVSLNNTEEFKMDSKEIAPVADAQGDKFDAILNAINSLALRVDAMEKENMPSEPYMKASDKKDESGDEEMMKKDSKSRKDEEEDCDDEEKKPRKDAEGKEEGKSGEIKFDEEEAMKADEEASKMADTQAKADSVYSAFGKQASRPLLGESQLSYRKRLLKGLQSYSDTYKNVNLNAINDEQLLSIAEKQIMADALQSSRIATHIPAGHLYEVKRQDASGRTITSYKGHISAFLDEFKLEPMKATKWFTNNNVERN